MGREDWTSEELEAAVECYSQIVRIQKQGEKVNKVALYRAYSADKLRNRSEAAIEMRMGNISAVLELNGVPQAGGLKPLRQVGSRVTDKLEPLLVNAGLLPTSASETTSDPEELSKRADVLRRRPGRSLPLGQLSPSTTTTSVKVFLRCPAVVAHALELAQGLCDLCRQPAPFAKANGDPYLEVHHVLPLASGGSDRPSNAVALCPNCHRRMHYAPDVLTLRAALYASHEHLIRED